MSVLKNAEMKHMQHFVLDMDTSAEQMFVRVRCKFFCLPFLSFMAAL